MKRCSVVIQQDSHIPRTDLPSGVVQAYNNGHTCISRRLKSAVHAPNQPPPSIISYEIDETVLRVPTSISRVLRDKDDPFKIFFPTLLMDLDGVFVPSLVSIAAIHSGRFIEHSHFVILWQKCFNRERLRRTISLSKMCLV